MCEISCTRLKVSTTAKTVSLDRVLGLHMLYVLPCKDYGPLERLRVARRAHLEHGLHLALGRFAIVLLDLVLNVHVLAQLGAERRRPELGESIEIIVTTVDGRLRQLAVVHHGSVAQLHQRSFVVLLARLSLRYGLVVSFEQRMLVVVERLNVLGVGCANDVRRRGGSSIGELERIADCLRDDMGADQLLRDKPFGRTVLSADKRRTNGGVLELHRQHLLLLRVLRIATG